MADPRDGAGPPASSPRQDGQATDLGRIQKLSDLGFPKQPCAVVKHAPFPACLSCLSCLVEDRQHSVLSTIVGCLQAIAPLRWPCMAPRPFSCPGTQFWRQACGKPSNLRRPRPKTATTEPRCTSSAASAGMPTQLPLANQAPPPCLSLSRSPLAAARQCILELSPWPRSGVAIAHADSGRTTPERSGRPRRRCRRELAGDG